MNNRITTADAFKLALALLVAALSFTLILQIGNFFMVILASLIFAIIMNLPTEALVNKKIPRFIAAIITHGAVLGIVGLIFYFLVPSLVSEVKNLAINNSDYINRLWEYAKSFGLPASSYLEPAAGALSKNLTGAIGSVFGVLVNILSFALIFFVSLSANMQKGGIQGTITLFIPLNQRVQAEIIYQKIQSRINRWIWGKMTTSALIAIMVYIGLSIIGVPNAALLATLAFFLDFIVYIGPILASIPAILLALAISPLHALEVVLLYIFINGILETFVFTPFLMKKAINVSPAIIILLVSLGGILAGPLGVILAIPTAAIIQVLLENQIKETI